MKEFKLEELEKNLVLLDNLSANDRLYDKLKDIGTNIIFPFRNELENNLLGETKEVQTSLIRTYVVKLHELQKNFSFSTEFLFYGTPDKYSQTEYIYTSWDGHSKTLSKYEIYLYESHWVFILLINELQRVCIINEIDFVKICSDLELSLIYINRHTTEDILNGNILMGGYFEGTKVVVEPIQKTDTNVNQSFENYLIHPNISKLIEELKKKTHGQKGKHIAIMILALEKCNMITYTDRTKLYESMREVFGDIGTNSGIDKYIAPYKRDIKDESKLLLTPEIERYSVFLKSI